LGSKRRFKPTEVAVLAGLAAWVNALIRQRLRIEKSTQTPIGLNKPTSSMKLKLDEAMRKGDAPKLTARELEIAHLILSGFSAKSISAKLAISAETVKVHKKHLYAKLGVESQSAMFSMFFNA
jgi:DNA-binding CsgD family transcriptional regulator